MLHNTRVLALVFSGCCLAVFDAGFARAADSPPLPGGMLPEPVVDGDFYRDGRYPAAQVELGRMLFFDKILSGNRNISCATCHHPKHATSDALVLPLGEGAVGLGSERKTGPGEHAVTDGVPRNAQALFFVGARVDHVVELVATGSRLSVRPMSPANFRAFRQRDYWVIQRP